MISTFYPAKTLTQIDRIHRQRPPQLNTTHATITQSFVYFVTKPLDYGNIAAKISNMNTTVKSARSRDTQRAYEGLRRLLIQEQIPVGKRLGEVEWSGRLGTSRPAIREALALLAHEELLSRGERGGFFVAKYSEDDLRKILQARIVLETGAIRLMAGLEIDPQKLAQMVEYCQTMEYLLDQEVLLGYGEVDRKFHMALVELADNEWLVKMYRRTPASHFVFPEADSAAIREMGLAAIRDHREIHKAISERRTNDAVTALEKHLTVDPSLHFKF